MLLHLLLPCTCRQVHTQGAVTPNASSQARPHHVEDNVWEGHLQDGQTVNARLVDGYLGVRSCLQGPREDGATLSTCWPGSHTQPPYLQAVVNASRMDCTSGQFMHAPDLPRTGTTPKDAGKCASTTRPTTHQCVLRFSAAETARPVGQLQNGRSVNGWHQDQP